MNCHKENDKSAEEGEGACAKTGYWALGALLAAGSGYMLWSGRQQELFAFLPFLLLLACPLMMFFMMRGHGGHGGHGAAGGGAAPAQEPAKQPEAKGDRR